MKTNSKQEARGLLKTVTGLIDTMLKNVIKLEGLLGLAGNVTARKMRHLNLLHV